MDSSDPAALAHATQFVDEVGLSDRAIYNSINGSITQENIDTLKNSNVDSAIVLAFNRGDGTVIGKEKVLNEGGIAGQDKSMLQIAKECGITGPILDTAAPPLGLGSAGSFRHILACKGIHGLPCGGAYHNMTVSWTWLKRWRRSGLAEIYEGNEALAEQMFHHNLGGIDGVRQAEWSSPDIGCNIPAMTLGADLIMFGPIESMEPMATSAAFCDIVLGEVCKELGGDIQDANHPFHRMI